MTKRTILRHATVVTVDAQDSVLTDAHVVIEDGAIVAVDKGLGPDPNAGDEVVELKGAIVMPGMVDTHAHTAMTLFRGIADDRDLQSFLDRVLPVETEVVTPVTVAAGARLGFVELLGAGCTSTLDMYWHPEASAAAAADAGLRLATGPLFIGMTGPDGLEFGDRMTVARASGPHPWLMAHGTYTMSLEQLEEVADLVADQSSRFHIHASENQAEVDTVVERFGRTPIELLDDAGLLGPRTVLAHAVVLSDDEVARLGATGTAVAHCPLSNLKLASGVCLVPDLRGAGAIVGLGTDGPSSSNDLDMFMAMRMAALIQKGFRLDATVMPAAEVLRMATIDGAKALGIDHLVGSIEVGKRADLVVLDPSSPSLTPSPDPISTVVYAASRADVTDVWVDGARVIADRRSTTIDIESAVAEVASLAAAMG